MKEAERHEVVLTIRNDGQGIDLHTGPKLSEVSKRVLRALELGGTPACVIQPGAMLGLGSVEARELRGKRIESMKPEPQPDDEALVESLARTAFETPTADDPPDRFVWMDDLTPLGRENCRIEVRAILAHLRAKGLMRTAGDAIAIANLQTELDATVEQNGRLIARASKAEGLLETAHAQVRALTQKAEEANAALDQFRTWLDKAHADGASIERAYQREQEARRMAENRCTTLRLDFDAATKRAHDAGQEAVRMGTELLEVKKRLETAEKALATELEFSASAAKRILALENQVATAPKWSGGRPVTQAEWDRYVALAAEVPQLKAELEETK